MSGNGSSKAAGLGLVAYGAAVNDSCWSGNSQRRMRVIAVRQPGLSGSARMHLSVQVGCRACMIVQRDRVCDAIGSLSELTQWIACDPPPVGVTEPNPLAVAVRHSSGDGAAECTRLHSTPLHLPTEGLQASSDCRQTIHRRRSRPSGRWSGPQRICSHRRAAASRTPLGWLSLLLAAASVRSVVTTNVVSIQHCSICEAARRPADRSQSDGLVAWLVSIRLTTDGSVQGSDIRLLVVSSLRSGRVQAEAQRSGWGKSTDRQSDQRRVDCEPTARGEGRGRRRGERGETKQTRPPMTDASQQEEPWTDGRTGGAGQGRNNSAEITPVKPSDQVKLVWEKD